MSDIFKFLIQNNLLVILANKNLGLTIVNHSWYNKKMNEHFYHTELFDFISDFNNSKDFQCYCHDVK